MGWNDRVRIPGLLPYYIKEKQSWGCDSYDNGINWVDLCKQNEIRRFMELDKYK